MLYIVEVPNKTRKQMTRVARPRFNAFDSAEWPTQESIYISNTYAGQINFVAGSWTADRKYICAHWVAEDGQVFKSQQQAAVYQAAISRKALLVDGLGF